jgi:flagellar biosynthesis/type III secretory pathway protein FliH
LNVTMGRVIKAAGAVTPAAPEPAAPAPPPPAADAADAADARERARREGLAAGQAEAVAQAAVLLAEARAEAARALQALVPAAVTLARKMAEKIVGRAVALDDRLMAEIAGEALAGCRPDVGGVRLRVHPDDLAAVERHRERLSARLPGAAIEVVADVAVGRHGCVVDTARGRIDARLDAQLDALERAVRGEAADA